MSLLELFIYEDRRRTILFYRIDKDYNFSKSLNYKFYLIKSRAIYIIAYSKYFKLLVWLDIT